MSKGIPKCKIAYKINRCAAISSEMCFWLSVRTVNDITNSMGRVLLEKLTVSQLVKKLIAFHGILRYATAVKRANHFSLS